MYISILTLILAFKIVVTLALVAAPFLFLPKEKLELATGIEAKSVMLFRLYGVAIASLLVGYATAFPAIASGSFPWGILLMGLTSNGGAFAVLIIWGNRPVMRVGALFFGMIFLALTAAMLAPELAIRAL